MEFPKELFDISQVYWNGFKIYWKNPADFLGVTFGRTLGTIVRLFSEGKNIPQCFRNKSLKKFIGILKTFQRNPLNWF